MHKVVVHAKSIGQTVASNSKTVGVMALSMIAAQKFIDLKSIAEKFKIDVKEGSMVEKVLEHQGALKFVIALIVIHATKNKGISKHEWFKWAMLGLMLQGALQEINAVTKGKSGQIGKSDEEIDKEMKQAMENIRAGMQGDGNTIGLQNPTEQFTPSVNGQENPTEMYTPAVSGLGSFEDQGSSVAGLGNYDDF